MGKNWNLQSTVVIIVILLAVIGVILPNFFSEVVTFTVTDKERITEDDSSKYLIFTDIETFENTDTVFYWKFNSSDIYGKIKEGNTYTAKVVGFRLPAVSMYRNIVEIQ